MKDLGDKMFPPQLPSLPRTRRLPVWALGLLLATTVQGQTSEPAPEAFPARPYLADYVTWARSHSPRLSAQAARSDALRENSRQVGALPGLKLAWGEMIVPVETRVGPQQRVLSISQSFPWFGSLSAREYSLESAADAAGETLRDLGWQVEHEVRSAWYELAFIQGRIAIVSRNLILAQQTESHVRVRYETGEGPYVSVLNAQMEIGRLDARLAGLQDRLVPATARLNIAAGLVSSRPTPEMPPSLESLVAAQLPTKDALEAALRRNNPLLASLRHEEESHRHGVDAAGRRSYPDLTVGLDYIMTGEARLPGIEDSGKDPVIARVAVNIPLWGGQADAEQKASTSLLRASSAGLSDTRLQLSGQLENTLFAWREAGRNLELYGVTLLPRSAQNLAVVTAGYESGQAHFDELQVARQAHLGLELALLRAKTDRLLALNDLGALLGVPMDDLARGDLSVSSGEPESE